MDIKHRLHEAFKSTMELITPARSVTAFREKGVLTPEEFVEAGDNLVSKCPTWSWEAGDATKRKPYLPEGKQFLVTRNVPCYRRVSAMEDDFAANGGEAPVGGDEDGDWTAAYASSGTGEAIPSMDAAADGSPDHAPSVQAQTKVESNKDVDDDEDIPDMAEFEDDDNALEEDPATLQAPYLVAHEPSDDNILRTRTYDISMTYDKYYQTPRVWLFGYDEIRHGLTPEQVLQDISQDHARKTVTIEDHPHLSGKFASIHPCKHGAVMKKILGILTARGGEPRVDQYLFIFLKFIASIIPTIEYDYTLDFDLAGR